MLSKRTPLRRKTALKRSRPINKIGRIARYRQARRAEWIRDHPPDHEGNYICYRCKRKVHVSAMRLDHVLPKGSTPKVIAEADDNLKPTHEVCNNEKGSQRI